MILNSIVKRVLKSLGVCNTVGKGPKHIGLYNYSARLIQVSSDTGSKGGQHKVDGVGSEARP